VVGFFLSEKSEPVRAAIERALEAAGRSDAEYKLNKVVRGANSVRLWVRTTASDLPWLLVKRNKPNLGTGFPSTTQSQLPSTTMHYQNRFRAKAKPPISAPRALDADDTNGILVCEAVGGLNVKWLLAQNRIPDGFDRRDLLRLAGQTLAEWHRSFPIEPGEVLMAVSEETTLFWDFSAWNLLMDFGTRTIMLIDFPGATVHGPAYSDLASFLHSLIVVAHNPLTRIRGGTWWDWASAFSLFLGAYANATGIVINRRDLDCMSETLRERVVAEINYYATKAPDPRLMLEAAWYSKLQKHDALKKGKLADSLSLKFCGDAPRWPRRHEGDAEV
jgi:hypothetical protein